MSSRSITPARAIFSFATAAPPPACAARQPGRYHAGCTLTSSRGALHGPTGGMQPPARDRDVVGWEPVGKLRRRARNASDQVDERRAVDGREFTGQLEAALGIVVSAHHRAPQTESAECTGNSSHD